MLHAARDARMRNTHSVPEATVARARHGDADAFEAIVRRYDVSLRVMTHRVLGAAWTEDVLQETYIRAFRALPNFVPERESSLAAWLHRIAYRACLDELGARSGVATYLTRTSTRPRAARGQAKTLCGGSAFGKHCSA
jgi:RNA polymerase sigma-70 factor, ECF subfamily